MQRSYAKNVWNLCYKEIKLNWVHAIFNTCFGFSRLPIPFFQFNDIEILDSINFDKKLV